MFFIDKPHLPTALRLVSACVVVILFVTMLFMAMPPKAEAIGIPFGGLSLWVTWCTCSFNLWIIVGPPRPGSFIYQPGLTTLYLFGQIYRPGVWLLGLAGPPSACFMWVGVTCAPVMVAPSMLIVGTSM